jgi:hypothetical protein
MHWREGRAKESAGGTRLGQTARKPQRVLTAKFSTATLTEISKLSEKLRGAAAPAISRLENFPLSPRPAGRLSRLAKGAATVRLAPMPVV